MFGILATTSEPWSEAEPAKLRSWRIILAFKIKVEKTSRPQFENKEDDRVFSQHHDMKNVTAENDEQPLKYVFQQFHFYSRNRKYMFSSTSLTFMVLRSGQAHPSARAG